MNGICVICLDNINLSNCMIRVCLNGNCENAICKECTQLTDKLRYNAGNYFCSTNCIIDYIKLYTEFNSQPVFSNLQILSEQTKIYEDIMSNNRYEHLVKIYPNVLAKIISEF